MKTVGIALLSVASVALVVATTPVCRPSGDCLAALLQRQIVAIATAQPDVQNSVQPAVLVVNLPAARAIRTTTPPEANFSEAPRRTRSSPKRSRLHAAQRVAAGAMISASPAPELSAAVELALLGDERQLPETACPQVATGQPS